VFYVFKCKKCGMGEGVTQDLSKPPVCCKKVGTFVRVRGTEAMTEERLQSSGQYVG
jgi:predicted nucleic acid-binding Zn ribbon protein